LEAIDILLASLHIFGAFVSNFLDFGLQGADSIFATILCYL